MGSVGTITSDAARGEALAGRLFESALGAFEVLSIHLGLRLGLLAALAKGGPMTSRELEAAAGVAERYTREWLEQQATAGILEVDDPAFDPGERSYSLPAGHAEALLDPDSLTYSGPFGEFILCVAKAMPQLLEAYATGGGVHYSHFDPEHRIGQGGFGRPGFVNLLTSDWLPNGAPDVHDRLLDHPAARVAEIGSGEGWAAIALARGYPTIRVDGFDYDAPSVAEARRNADAAAVADRVSFSVADAADPSLAGVYDLVMMFEVLHDLSKPVEVLRSVRRMLAPGASALVVDERVSDRFTAPGGPVERFMYVASVLHCLPASMAEPPSAATGTAMRSDTVRAYAAEAGFAAVEVLPVEHDFFRFYRLRP